MAHTTLQREDDTPTTAFVLSLLAGLWILAMDGMMGGWNEDQLHSLMSGQGVFGSWMRTASMFTPTLWQLFSLLVGLLVLAGATLLYVRPCHRHIWGAIIVGASALDFLFGAGGILAGVLGVIGGTVAIAS
jgi:hypothetical protein